MPTIAMFLGILISMRWDGHLSPHFHAWYQGKTGTFSLDGIMTDCNIPKRQQNIILGWAAVHAEELAANWETCELGEDPYRIEPVRF